MAKYTNEQLSRMAINPETEGRIIDRYPYVGDLLHAGDLTHGKVGSPEDVLIRYLAYLYDPQSPLVREFPDPCDRKKHAASLTKCVYEDRFNKFAVLFLQEVIRSLEWRVILAKEQAFKEYEERVLDPIKVGPEVKDTDIMAAATKKDMLLTHMAKISQELPKLKDAFFGGDDDLQKEAQRRVYTAEAIAARVSKK